MSRRLVLRIMVVLSVFVTVSCSDGASQSDPVNKPNEPPVTTILPNQKFISHQRDIELNCTDSNVGDSCANTYFSWEGQTPTVAKGFEYNGAFKVGEALQYNDDDIISVNYFSVDTKNAEEKVKIKEYILDKTAPVAVADIPAGTSNSALDLTFTCSDKKAANPLQDGSGCRDFYYYTTADVSDTPDSSPGNTDFSVVALKNSGVIDLVIPLNSSTYVHYFAVDAAGSRQVVKKAFYEFVPLVSDVVNFKALAGNGQVTLSWEIPADPSILGVQIMRSQVKAPNLPSEGVLVYKGPISPKIDPSLVIGQTYYYTAFAYDGSGNFSLGVANSATPFSDPPPAEVTGLSGIAGNAQVIFNWTNPTDTDFAFTTIRRSANKAILSILDGVEVYKSTGLPGTNDTATDPGLVNNKLYYYGVFTVDIKQNVSAGSFLSVTPVDLPPDNIPTFTATAGDNFVNLSWSYPTDPDVAGVKIVRTVAVDGPPTAHDDPAAELIANVKDLTITTLKDSTVTNNKSYFYAAYAFDKKPTTPNYSLKGKIAGPVTPVDITPPAEVTGLTTTPADGKIALSWTNPADLDFVNVLILRKTGSYANSRTDTTATKVNPGTVQPLIDDNAGAGLTNGTTYFYTIYTLDEVPNYSAGMQIQETPAIDNAGPTVSTTIPTEAATGVNPNSGIEVTFSEDILGSSVVDAVLSMTAKTGVDSLGAPITRTIAGAKPTMPSTSSIKLMAADGQFPLASTITASLKVAANGVPGVTDLSDNPLDPTPQTGQYDWTFTTADGSWDALPTDPNDAISDVWAIRSDVAVDDSGIGIVVWNQDLPTVNSSEVKFRYFGTRTGVLSSEFTISRPGRDSSKASIRMDRNGNAIIVWREIENNQGNSGHLYATRILKGSPFDSSSVVLLQNDLASCVKANDDIALEVDGNGIVTVVWTQGSCPGKTPTNIDLWAKRFSITAPDWLTLPAAELIEWDDRSAAEKPQIAVDSIGNALVVWNQYDSTTKIRNVMYNYFDNSIGAKKWKQPIDPTAVPLVHPTPEISNNTNTFNDWKPSVSIDNNGNAIAIWCHRYQANPTASSVRVVWASHFNLSMPQIWSTPKIISDIATFSSDEVRCDNNYPVHLAMHSDGSAIAVWPGFGSTFEAHANRFDPTLGVSGNWQGDIKISNSTLFEGKVVIDSTGNALVIYRSSTGSVEVLRYLSGTAWATDSIIFPPWATGANTSTAVSTVMPAMSGTSSQRPQMSIDSSGNAAATWIIRTTDSTTNSGYTYSPWVTYFNNKQVTP